MLVATLHPQPDVPSSVRKVPAPKLPAAATAPLISDVTEAIAIPLATTREPQSTPPPQPAARPGRRARALQAASHDQCGDPREAPPGAGPAAAHEPERRRSGSHRPCVDGTRRATRKGEVRPNGSTARPRVPPIPAHAMSPRICDARSADATAIDAPSSGPKAAVPRRPGSSTITAFRSPMAGRRPSTISNCAALRTTPTKPSGGSGRCSCGRPAARGRAWSGPSFLEVSMHLLLRRGVLFKRRSVLTGVEIAAMTEQSWSVYNRHRRYSHQRRRCETAGQRRDTRKRRGVLVYGSPRRPSPTSLVDTSRWRSIWLQEKDARPEDRGRGARRYEPESCPDAAASGAMSAPMMRSGRMSCADGECLGGLSPVTTPRRGLAEIASKSQPRLPVAYRYPSGRRLGPSRRVQDPAGGPGDI